MRARLKREEKQRISRRYAEDELFQAIMENGPELESELPGFGLSPEECFLEVRELVDAIRELDGVRSRSEKTVSRELNRLWTTRYNELRTLDRQVSEAEMRKVVGIIFGFAAVVLESSTAPFLCITLPRLLTEIVAPLEPVAHDRRVFEGWGKTLHDKIFIRALPYGWLDGRTWVGEKADGEKPPKKSTAKKDAAPPTFPYKYHDKEEGIRRIEMMMRALERLGWIEPPEKADDFHRLFSGRPRACNVRWKEAGNVLYALTKALLEQDYMEHRSGVSAKAIVTGQFGRNRSNKQPAGHKLDTIAILVKLLDVTKPAHLGDST